MGVSNTCDEGAQCAQVANIGPIVDARPADTSPPFMAGRSTRRVEDVHEDHVYMVDVPELPGFTTHGRTYEDAVMQAQDAIDGWIYGHRASGCPIPLPSVYRPADRSPGLSGVGRIRHP